MGNRTIEGLNVENLLTLSHKIELLIKSDQSNNSYADEGAVNMRDLSRFLNLYQSFMLRDQASSDHALVHAFRISYLQRLSQSNHQAAFDLLRDSALIQDHSLHSDLIQKSLTKMIRIDYTSASLNFLNSVKQTSLTPHTSSASILLDSTT